MNKPLTEREREMLDMLELMLVRAPLPSNSVWSEALAKASRLVGKVRKDAWGNSQLS